MILKGSGPTIYSSIITFIKTHNCHHILHDQPDHLLPDHQHPGDEPARLTGQANIITVVPRLPGQSSTTPVAPRTCMKQPGTVVHMLDVWLQSRLVRGRRDWSTLDLEIGFTEYLLMCPYTRYVCKLLRLFHHLRLDV